MKNQLIVIACAGSLFLTANGWNDFTGRYSAAGHIPSTPLYFQEPVKTAPSRAEMASDIENLKQELAELQRGVPYPHTAHNKESKKHNSAMKAAKKQTAHSNK